jgi:hypothetical protein
MPKPKKPSYKILIGKLLASKNLSPGERTAFEGFSTELRDGKDLTEHQKLWVESLRHKADA